MFVSRGIQDVGDPYAKCRQIFKIAEEFHNKERIIEMKQLNSLVYETATAL